MKRVFVHFLCFMFLGLICGCMTTNAFVSPKSEVKAGDRVRLSIRKLKVVQVVGDKVHVMHESERGLRIAIIPLVNDYVSNAYLRCGLYEYIGPHKYETIKDLSGNTLINTIRLFKEVEDVE